MSVADDWRKRFAVVLIGAVCIGVVAGLLGPWIPQLATLSVGFGVLMAVLSWFDGYRPAAIAALGMITAVTLAAGFAATQTVMDTVA